MKNSSDTIRNRTRDLPVRQATHLTSLLPSVSFTKQKKNDVLLFPAFQNSGRAVIFGRLPGFTRLPFWPQQHADGDKYRASFVFDPQVSPCEICSGQPAATSYIIKKTPAPYPYHPLCAQKLIGSHEKCTQEIPELQGYSGGSLRNFCSGPVTATQLPGPVTATQLPSNRQ